MTCTRCAHPRAAHEHHRKGSEYSVRDCPRFALSVLGQIKSALRPTGKHH